MALGILGVKIGMTRIFNEAGAPVPVTVIQAGPCPVVQQKQPEKAVILLGQAIARAENDSR